MDYNKKEAMLANRESLYKAECGFADTLDVLGLMLTLPVKDKAERVYCYCSLKGKNVLFVAFYTVGDKAVLFAEDMDKVEMMELNMAVMSQLVYMKSQYEGCEMLMPSELFLEYEPASRKPSVLAGMEDFTDPNEVNIRALTWFKEHGGTLKRSAELAMKTRFRAQAAAARNPAANAQPVDVEALQISRSFVAGEIDDPALTNPSTGWDAVRAEFHRAYAGDADPMSFESDDGKSWIDVYDGGDCWNYVSCGLSAMGEAPEAGSLGAEYTVSLKKKQNQDEDDMQIFRMLGYLRQAISKAQADAALLDEYAYMALEEGGFIVLPESKLKTVNGPSGSIAFRRLVYIGADELESLQNGGGDVRSLYIKLGRDVSKF